MPQKFTEEELLTEEFRRRLQRLYELEAFAKQSRTKATTDDEHRAADLLHDAVGAARIELRRAERALAQLRERRSK